MGARTRAGCWWDAGAAPPPRLGGGCLRALLLGGGGGLGHLERLSRVDVAAAGARLNCGAAFDSAWRRSGPRARARHRVRRPSLEGRNAGLLGAVGRVVRLRGGDVATRGLRGSTSRSCAHVMGMDNRGLAHRRRGRARNGAGSRRVLLPMAGMEKPRGLFVDWWFRTLLAGARAHGVRRRTRCRWRAWRVTPGSSSGAAMMQSRRANARVRGYCVTRGKRETHLPTTFRNRHLNFGPWARSPTLRSVIREYPRSISRPDWAGKRRGKLVVVPATSTGVEFLARNARRRIFIRLRFAHRWCFSFSSSVKITAGLHVRSGNGNNHVPDDGHPGGRDAAWGFARVGRAPRRAVR